MTTPRAKGMETIQAPSAGLDAPEQEASLPLTPIEQGLVEQDTPRRGILYSSPSKRPRREKISARPPPLKPKKPPTTKGNETRMEEEFPKEIPEETVAPTIEDEIVDTPQPAPLDPEEESKKQEKEILLREFQELQEEVQRYERELERFRNAAPEEFTESTDLDGLITLINNADPLSLAAPAEQKPPPLSSLLSSFIPFSKPYLATSTVTPISETKPVASHAPLDLDDPLPYLRLFTPFAYESRVSIPDSDPSSPASSQLYQTHTVDITAPLKLFTTTIAITIDTSTQTVVNLTIPYLSPWAEYELGTWIREKSQKKDVGAICWALSSYWDVSVRRAECWVRSERSFKDVLNERNGVRKPPIEKWKKGQPRTDDIADQSLDENDAESEEVSGVVVDGQEESSATAKRKAPNISRQQLQKHLGREMLICESPEVLFKISWRIGFDWTGEAESEVKATAAFPKAWYEADALNSLKKVPVAFDALVKDRGVFEATRAMVGLLFS